MKRGDRGLDDKRRDCGRIATVRWCEVDHRVRVDPSGPDPVRRDKRPPPRRNPHHTRAVAVVVFDHTVVIVVDCGVVQLVIGVPELVRQR